MANQKKRVAVIYGGRSVEHEVSVITALQVMAVLNRNKYEIVPIYITKGGAWYTDEMLFTGNPRSDVNFHDKLIKYDYSNTLIALPPDSGIGGLISPVVSGFLSRTKIISLDVVIPVIHGTNGEDGTLQGVLELANIPYVGSGVVGSAVGMDKIMTKAVIREHGLPVMDYIWFSRNEWECNSDQILDRVMKELNLPVFVKPANLGSSIGISRADTIEQLREAIEIAKVYDYRILVEHAIENVIEINCSVIGNNEPMPSVCEQPISWRELLSFEDKYLHNAKTGMKGAEKRIPAPISEELTRKIQDMSVQAFHAMNCRGIARIDFLVSLEKDQVYLNEINTIPGSYSFHLWSASGIKPSELMDRLIQFALDTHLEKQKTTFSYISGLLEKASAELLNRGNPVKFGLKTT